MINAGKSKCPVCKREWVVTPMDDCMLPACGCYGEYPYSRKRFHDADYCIAESEDAAIDTVKRTGSKSKQASMLCEAKNILSSELAVAQNSTSNQQIKYEKDCSTCKSFVPVCKRGFQANDDECSFYLKLKGR